MAEELPGEEAEGVVSAASVFRLLVFYMRGHEGFHKLISWKTRNQLIEILQE